MYKPNYPGIVVIEGHVQGLANTRALGEMEIPVFVVDVHNCIARYSKYCTKFIKSPHYLTDDFTDFLISIGRKYDLNNWVLLPSNDHAVYNISKNRNKLVQIYNIITPGFEIIENIYNKENLLKSAFTSGVPIPDTYYPGTVSPNGIDLSFPVITKGKYGLTFYKLFGRKAFLAQNISDLRVQYREIENKLPLNEVFTQELIPKAKINNTISFTAFCINGEIKSHWIGVKVREHPYRFGTATFCKSISEPSLLEFSALLLKDLKYTGVCEVEYIRDPRDNKYKLIEINPRTWLWVELAKKCGVNYPQMIYNHLNGIKNEYPSSYKINKKWIHVLTDLPYAFKGLIDGKYTLMDIVTSYLGNPIPAVFNKSDMIPSLAELLLIPSFLMRR